jgi:glycosyltransferase involved in cell wall biosynthesis
VLLTHYEFCIRIRLALKRGDKLSRTIKYVAFYANESLNNENRQMAHSAVNKIDYISDSLNSLDYNVEIVSPSWTNSDKGYYKKQRIQINEKKSLEVFASFGAKNKIARGLKYIFSLLQTTFYLLFKTTKHETIIVYHSVMLFFPIIIAQYIKKIKVILEVEEIYQDIQNMSKIKKKMELSMFDKANAYILSTEMLNERLNPLKKPYVCVYGSYKVEADRNLHFNDEKIHVVYAGTFDPKKGGALAAIKSSKYLSSNYHVHILGFGSEDQIKEVISEINKINKESNGIVTYDGLLQGNEFTNFLQKCDIGLSTQNPDAKYNESSFPSKILTYMANGLKVVSVKIKVIEISRLNEDVHFYNSQNPKYIAEAIMKVNTKDKNLSRNTLSVLNKEFIKNIKSVIDTVK